jgi:hypothetical protein
MRSHPAPQHDRISPLTRAIEIACLAGAAAMLALAVLRASRAGLFVEWWTAPTIVIAALGADLVSGIVHWTADTWGSETMPFLGRRFLRPFRVHHINPDDFLRRDFVDCNGDVAMLNMPLLAAALSLPLSAPVGRIGALALIAFCAAALPTNQVHQWAHMPAPPRIVAWLQQARLLLGRDDHARHHREPYVSNYCIATGWCNGMVTAVGLFQAAERAVTRLTGLRPRSDERRFVAAIGAPGDA